MRCPVCEYPDAEKSYELGDRFFGVADGVFSLYCCPSCELLFQDAVQIRDRLASFYPSGYWWRGDGRLAYLERLYREWVVRNDHLRFVQSIVADPAGSTILEIGCGSGLFVKLARQAGLNAFGLDPSPEAVEAAHSAGIRWIRQGSVEELIESGETYDTLLLFHVLEHVADPFRYLRSLRRLLRKPGSLIVQVPNRDSFQARIFGRRWYGIDCPRHVCNFTQDSLLHLLGRAGFRIQKLRHFSLRDNSPAMVSSLFPFLDPVSQKVRYLRVAQKPSPILMGLKELTYFGLVLCGLPFAWAESKLGNGGTISVFGTVE